MLFFHHTQLYLFVFWLPFFSTNVRRHFQDFLAWGFCFVIENLRHSDIYKTKCEITMEKLCQPFIKLLKKLNNINLLRIILLQEATEQAEIAGAGDQLSGIGSNTFQMTQILLHYHSLSYESQKRKCVSSENRPTGYA